MKQLKLIFLFIAFSTSILAQNSDRTYISAEMSVHGDITIVVNDGVYSIKPFSDKIIETTFIPNGEVYNPNSHAVVMSPNAAPQFISDKEKDIIKTSGISVTIQKHPFQISYSYKGKPLVSEKNGYTKSESAEFLDFNITDDEVLYGGGARVLGMNRRGNRLQLYNRAHYGYETHSELMNFTMPIVLSSKMYAIHFDNAPIGYLDLDSKKTNTLTYETISGRKTYQVIAGNDWQDLISNYTALTGKQPLPPRWVFGNFASRMGYHSEKETRETVQKFEDEDIPLDAVIIDLYWFGKELMGTMGNLEFHKDSFPTPKKMIADFKEKGVKTVLITEPFILTTSKKWEEVSEKNLLGKDSLGNPYKYNFYFGETGIIDIYNPAAKKWFWNIYKDLIADFGVAGWWGDLGEPEVHPSDLLHETGTADEVHNIYGHDWAKLVFEGYQQNFPEQRPFILMRAGYSGSQRYGMIPWSGDVNRTWGGLQAQPEITLQMSMQGMAYMHSDLGGFAGGEVLDAELYTRWLQYGVFQPIFRPHSQESVAPEPVFHDDKTIALAKESVDLRYKLLPYNYTLAFKNNQDGIAFMQPLFFEESDNVDLLSSAESYFWGHDFLVSPILKQGVTEHEVYFPKSNNWFDFYTDKKYLAGTTSNIKTHENYIPTFVRAGAFIPMIQPIHTTDLYSLNRFELHYYFDDSIKKSNGKLYNDDGTTPNAFEKGAFELLYFKSTKKGKYLIIEIDSEIGANYTSEKKQIELIIHNISSKPKKVKKHKSEWSSKKHILKIVIDYQKKTKTIKIKL
ncbi:MAG: glycoside hydrolase family 31 protein [Flavobacteriaceae bacterium]